ADGGRRRRCAAGLDEARPVVGGDRRALGIYEVGERVGQAELGGPDRALRRRAEQPGRRLLGQARQDGGEPGEGMVGRHLVLEQGEQLDQLLREVVGGGSAAVALQRQ